MGATAGNGEDPLTTIAIRRSTRDKLEKIGGAEVSKDRVVDAVADAVIRERLVERVRRKILGVAEDAASRIIPETARNPPAEEPGPGRK